MPNQPPLNPDALAEAIETIGLLNIAIVEPAIVGRLAIETYLAVAQPVVNSAEYTPPTAFYVELNIDTAGNATQTNGKSFYSWLENILAEAWDEGQLAGRNNAHHTNWDKPIQNPYHPVVDGA